MIATQYINSTTQKPGPYKDYEVINVLKWKNSRWKSLCPFYMRTDGNEICVNPGNIIFENFYQGLKVYDAVYKNTVYASRFHSGKPEHLWWKFEPVNEPGKTSFHDDEYGDIMVNEDENINYDLYFRWRNSLWDCENPIRHPNRMHRHKNTKFSLVIDTNNTEIRMDYLTSRREIYLKEYIRLAKKTPEYTILLNKLKSGKNIMLCEVDVPAQNKWGSFGILTDENNNICELTIEHLEILLNDLNAPFGHGLCLAYSLLRELI